MHAASLPIVVVVGGRRGVMTGRLALESRKGMHEWGVYSRLEKKKKEKEEKRREERRGVARTAPTAMGSLFGRWFESSGRAASGKVRSPSRPLRPNLSLVAHGQSGQSISHWCIRTEWR